MRNINQIYKTACCLLSFAATASVATAQTNEAGGIHSITEREVEAHVRFLSSDALRGREAGSEGGQAAAEYIEAQLRICGIAPWEGVYKHPFNAYAKDREKRSRWEVRPDSIAAYKQGAYRRLNLCNVLGWIEGKKKDEFIVFGTHYDHVGMDPLLAGDKIYNGADDNASGVAALLAIAKAYAQMGEQPEKSILFAFWDGEERGLLGSKQFVQDFETEKIEGYINFDMIGRTTYRQPRTHVVFFYTASHPEFEAWTRHSVETYSLQLTPDYRAWDKPTSGSDNATFAHKNIPLIWYHTDAHDDYHQPSDEADKIDYKKLTDIAKAAFCNLFDMANKDF